MNSQIQKKKTSWNPKAEAAFVELWEKKASNMKGEQLNEVFSEMAYQMRQFRKDTRIADVKYKLFNFIKKYKQYKQDLVSGAYPASWPLYERIHRIILKNPHNGEHIFEDIDYESNIEESSDHSSSSPSVSNSTFDNNTLQEDENSLFSSNFNALKSAHEYGKKRRRRGPQISWQMEEEKELIAFLKENKDTFEKPTAHRFYTEFLQSSSFYREWKTVGNKVRNMRIKYEKAKAFLKSPDPSIMQKGETHIGTMYRLCYYFEDFREIFHDNDNISTSSFSEIMNDVNEETTSATSFPVLNCNVKSPHGNKESIVSEDNSSESSSILKGNKRKRTSTGIHKLWSPEEEKQIAIFLRDNKLFFEKPTALRFYEHFLLSNNMDTEPKIVRCKVRNMRLKYERAKLFLKSPDTSLMQDGETIQDTVKRICHYYEDFKETFDENNETDDTSYPDLMNDTNEIENDEPDSMLIKDEYSVTMHNGSVKMSSSASENIKPENLTIIEVNWNKKTN